MRHLASLAILLLFASLSPALAAGPVNTQDGVALQGYDPVSFFESSGPVQGSAGITASHDGATYRFASAENRADFQADPARYAPAFGGYCAYGVSLGKLFPIEVDTWQVIDGSLVLNKDLEVKRLFDEDRAENFAKARAEWAALSE